MQLSIRFSGYLAGLKVVEPRSKLCKICKSTAHWAGACPKKQEKAELRKVIFKCNRCGGFECKRDSCKNYDEILKGNVPKPISKLAETKLIKEQRSKIQGKKSTRKPNMVEKSTPCDTQHVSHRRKRSKIVSFEQEQTGNMEAGGQGFKFNSAGVSKDFRFNSSAISKYNKNQNVVPPAALVLSNRFGALDNTSILHSVSENNLLTNNNNTESVQLENSKRLLNNNN